MFCIYVPFYLFPEPRVSGFMIYLGAVCIFHLIHLSLGSGFPKRAIRFFFAICKKISKLWLRIMFEKVRISVGLVCEACDSLNACDACDACVMY